MSAPLTAEAITLFVSALLSALFILFPPAKAWFIAKSGDTQRALTGGVILAVAAATVGASCTGLVPSIECTTASIGGYIQNVALAAVLGLGVSQAAFGVAKLGKNKSRGLVLDSNKLLD